MPRFSQRIGLTPIRDALQKDSMDNALRYGLWNTMSRYYWAFTAYEWSDIANQSMNTLPALLYRDYFSLPLDDMPDSWQAFHRDMKNHFTSCEWYGVYDFIEFLANLDDYADVVPDLYLPAMFIKECNTLLEKEKSAYRFVGTIIAPITSEQEIASIEGAIATAAASNALNVVAIHLQRAVAALADRAAPDFPNSMKESISAVEALCKLITGDDKATLGRALNEIETKRLVPMHPHIKAAFQSLYSYSSDAGGIRHALKDAPDVALEDATFMLVTCSAFVNYMIEKARKAGIAL
ncbi:MAG TPA: hypothetical protein VH591_07305 [Ktedonobacterales bacterium]|jgi:hypothetical protein